MKTKLKTVVITIFLFIIFIFIYTYPKVTIETVLFGINIWFYNVLPTLFPFFILSDLFVNYGLIDLIFNIWYNRMGCLYMQ